MTKEPPAPQPAHCSLHQLKRKLLQEALDPAFSIELYKRLCGAANEAASIAWSTDQPLLLFPCLFEELSAEVKAHFALNPQFNSPAAESGY